MSHLIEGRAIAEKVYAELRGEIAELKRNGRTPGLAVVLVGDNPASRAYVRSKDKMCRDLGLHSVKLELPADTTQEDLLARVRDLNRDPAIHGILVQSPPPKHIDEAAIIRALDPAKDVDGFHPMNVAKLALGDDSGFVPCTPLGCQRLLIESGTEIAGAHVVVLGRSMIVGKPLALLLMRKGKGGDATVTVVHSRSQRLAEITRSADILIAAIGQPEFVRAEHVREGAVVIDVGINRVDDPTMERGYRLVGDVAFAEISDKASAITPVLAASADDDRDADGEHSPSLPPVAGIADPGFPSDQRIPHPVSRTFYADYKNARRIVATGSQPNPPAPPVPGP